MNTSIETSQENPVALTDDELMLYARQILLNEWGIDAQENLRASTAIIVGAGGLGCPVSETLTRAGIGHLYLIDDDVIELSNLQRQTLFTPADVGSYKAEIAAKMLKKINPFINVDYKIARILPENIEEIIPLSTFIASTETETNDYKKILLLDCSDNFAIRILLNEFSVQHNIALLSASAVAMSGQLALYEPMKKTGCYHCVFGEVLNDSKSSLGAQNCVNSGVLASTTTVMGNFQANVALQYLGLGHNPLTGQLLTWDAKRMRQYNIRYRQNDSCSVCGS